MFENNERFSKIIFNKIKTKNKKGKDICLSERSENLFRGIYIYNLYKYNQFR